MNRGVSIAALSACGLAGLAAAVLLAAAPQAGAAEGTTSTTPTTTTPTTTTPTTTTPTTTMPTTTTPTTTTPTTTMPTTTTPRPSRPRVIVAGVTVGGMLVGGLTAAEAREILTARFSRPLRLVGGPGARIAVSPADLGAVAHIAAAVQLAARIRRPGFAVPLKVDISGSKVDRLVASLAKRFNREPVEATLRLRDFRPIATRDVSGRRLRAVVAARAISLALKTQQRHPLELSFDENAAPVSSNDLGRAIVIRRASNELYLYRIGTKPKLIRMFRVATGRPQYPTPLGKFEVVNMQLHPWWYPPAGSEWAKGAEPIPPGPGNPLGTRWMGISSPNVGIHGTSSPSSIGYSASHGCIRMLIADAEWLYEKVDLGTPVFIVAA